jgi:tetratricopeptide (TPR) repeat protein
MAARCYSQRKANGWMIDRAAEIAETSRLVYRAIELGRDDAVALCMAGFAVAFVVGDLDNGDALINRALQLNPNLAWAWLYSGWVKVYLGEPEVALERVARAMRLSPNDPQIFNMQTVTAYAHFVAGRYAEALTWAESAVRERPGHITAVRILAASCAMGGQQQQAQKAMARLRLLDPELRISNLKGLIPFREPEHFAKWEAGLLTAGLPK